MKQYLAYAALFCASWVFSGMAFDFYQKRNAAIESHDALSARCELRGGVYAKTSSGYACVRVLRGDER